MSVTNNSYDTKSGVRRITITTGPQLHPFSESSNSANNYYCLGLDSKGFQYQIDLQALPVGVTKEQIQPNQVWWVEKRTSLYRLYLYAGQYDAAAKQVVSTATLPIDPNTPFLTASGGTISGNLTVNGTITQNGVPVVNNIWSVGSSSVVAISGYNTYLIIMTGYGGRTTTGYLTYLFNQSYNASMMSPSTLITLNTYALTSGANYSSSATAVFQPTGGYSTTWYAETVNQNYITGAATAVVVGLN